MRSIDRRTVVKSAAWTAPILAAGVAAPAAAASDDMLASVIALWPSDVLEIVSWTSGGDTQHVATKFKVQVNAEGHGDGGVFPIPAGDVLQVSYDARLLADPSAGSALNSDGAPVSDPLREVDAPAVVDGIGTVTYQVPMIQSINKYFMDSVGPIVTFGSTPPRQAEVRSDYAPITITWTSAKNGVLPPDVLPVSGP